MLALVVVCFFLFCLFFDLNKTFFQMLNVRKNILKIEKGDNTIRAHRQQAAATTTSHIKSMNCSGCELSE